MRIDDLRMFLLLARHKSLGQAAEQLGLTQSALSKALARLEAEAGVQLFERSARGVTLTSIGAKLLERARSVVLATQDLEEEIQAHRAALLGKIRLAATPYMVSTLLTPVIARFLASRPLAGFVIETSLTWEAIRAVQAGNAELACGGLTAELPQDIDHIVLQPLRLHMVARSNHPRLNTLTTPAALAQERWALPRQSSSLHQVLADRFTRNGLPPPQIAVEWTGSGIAIGELLRNTDLLSLMPPRALAQAEGRGLSIIDESPMLRQTEIALFWRKGGYLSPLCMEFKNTLIEFCREE